MARWHIRGHLKHDQTFEAWVSGKLSERQIIQLLARLHCRHLSDAEVVAATTASRDRDRTDFMVTHMNGGYMTTGSQEHYIARFEETDA